MKILVLLPRFPYPLDKGDKLRAYHQLVELSKRHEVHLFALSHEAVGEAQVEALRPHCKSIYVERLHAPAIWWGVLRAFLKGQSLQLGYWTTRRAQRHYHAFEQQVQPDVVYCQMVRTLPTVTGSPYRKVLDFQDALSLNTHRRMERAHGLWRLILNYEEKALKRAEQEALRLFNATTIISPIDRDAISPAITLVPNGVDTDYFKGERLKVKSETADVVDDSHLSPLTSHLSPHAIVFTGNMSYAPNVDAARYLVEEVMPLVWERCPYANVLLAGADPKPAVKALAGPKVTVSGRLDDIRTAYASAKIFVAPMRIGSGMQNKLLEAMSMGLPCVTTSIAATPLGAIPGEHLLVGDNAAELATHIASLLTDSWQQQQLADAGHRFVQERYSWPAAVAPLEAILTN